MIMCTRQIKANEINFRKLSTYHQLVERLLQKISFKTLFVPTANSICRRLEVARDVISGVEGIGPKAYQ